ncbi:hypothetical protein ZWY2020_034140 [Hordeum vulgare]|nr:hypothetical protein ZWY2020_034140 [Hordeum vulgare]
MVLGMEAGCVLNEGCERTPVSSRCCSSGSDKKTENTAGRKPSRNMAAPSPSIAATKLSSNLGAVVEATGTRAKAKRSKATLVVQRAPSVRAKTKLGAMSSMSTISTL